MSYIEENDSDAIIIILDHGGWVDIGSYDEMLPTDANQLHSIFQLWQPFDGMEI